MNLHKSLKWGAAATAATVPGLVRASEADIHIPDLRTITFFDGSLSGTSILMIGLVVCALGMIYGWIQYIQTRNLPVHASMSAVSQIIWEEFVSYRTNAASRELRQRPSMRPTSASCQRSGSLEMIFCAVEFAPMR
jgi:hypothetical protein